MDGTGPTLMRSSRRRKPSGEIVGGRELWVHDRIGDWIAAYRLIPQGGRAIVGEVRVFPAGDRKGLEPGEWSGRNVPLGGVPQRVLRQVRISIPRDLIPEILKEWKGRYGAKGAAAAQDLFGFSKLGFEPERLTEQPRRPGRAGRSDLFYAQVAALYVGALEQGSRSPILDVTEALKTSLSREWLSSESVRQVVNKARARRLLTPAPPGRAGGQLTERARELLKPARL